MSLIIWINGAFGSGKTETAKGLQNRITNSFIYDPEMAGEFIWDNSPCNIRRKGDFQDIQIWRDFNYQMLKYLYENYTGTIIVPMTLVNKEYYNQIIGRLKQEDVTIHHYVLYADKTTILDRLASRGEVDNCWAAQQIDRCLAAFEKDIIDERINTINKGIDDVVTLILGKSDIH